MVSDPGVLDLSFRTGLRRLNAAGRLCKVSSKVDPDLELASIVRRHDSNLAFWFERVGDHPLPLCCNVLVSHPNVLAVFGLDTHGVRACLERAIARPLPLRPVAQGACQEVVISDGINLEALFPVLHHMPKDAGKVITGGVIIAKDPETGVRNASIHRLQLVGPDRTAIKLDLGRHLRAYYEKAKARGRPLEIAAVIGADLSLTYAASMMGAQIPLDQDELAVAGGLRGAPLEVVPCRTVDLEVPAEAEFVIEAEILPDETVWEGPFLEFIGLYSEPGWAPVVRVKAVTHRRDPIYYAIIGAETRVLRKYVMEALIERAVRASVPIVTDVNLTPGGLCRFHLVMAVRKRSPQDEGLQRNAVFAAVAALKDLDLVIVVDDDIDIHNPADVEYALATRMEASQDLFLLPGARGHEYILVSEGGLRGVRTKVGIDATVPYDELPNFRRVEPLKLDLAAYEAATDPRPPGHPAFTEAPPT
ncbi:MAG: UbiD family decarboxylase [Deltaproteobacteria bacterium]|nr:UbiD family decarboxylase [Deltaproteobacteria bacterium]